MDLASEYRMAGEAAAMAAEVEAEMAVTPDPTGAAFFPAGVLDGRNAALIYLESSGGLPVSLRQIVAATLQPRIRYTLSVGVGNIASGIGLPPFDFRFYDLDGFPGYSVQLRAASRPQPWHQRSPMRCSRSDQ